MLWIALDFPCLPLDTFALSSAHTEPWAIADGTEVLVCNTPAQALGVRNGMRLSAASALAPQLNYRLRDKAAEAATLATLAAWANKFTPNVSLEPPRALLLEIEGSLRCFGGIRTILQTLQRELDDMGYAATMACAPTATAALLLARAGMQKVVNCKRALEAVVASLPLAALDCDAQTPQMLQAVGVRHVAELMALPRDGLARRGGRPLLDTVDRALGRLPAPRQFFVPPAQFSVKLELAAPVAHSEALLFAARRLINQLTGFLAARNGGIQRFTLTLMHERSAATRVDIGLVAPTRDPVHLTLLVRERLGALALNAPVHALGFEADDILVLAEANRELFADRAEGQGEWQKLVERLRARLGPQGGARRGRGGRASARTRVARQRARHRQRSARARAAAVMAACRAATVAGSRRKPALPRNRARPGRGSRAHRIRLVGRRRRQTRLFRRANARSLRRYGFTATAARPAAGICTASLAKCAVDVVCLPYYRRTPSCTASAISLFCAALRTLRNSSSAPPSLATRRSPSPTNARSLAMVRAHIAAKEYQLKLIIGAEFRLADGLKLVLLATDREAYGNLSQLITTARRRSEKGSYQLDWTDVERGAGACLVLWIPGSTAGSRSRAAHRDTLSADRAWIAVELLCGPDDRAQLERLHELSPACGLPLVAAGDVHMHVRSRRPLQDTLTAIRLGTPVADAKHALYPNAERHLRLRVRLAQIYPPSCLPQRVRIAARCDFSLDSLRYEYPEELVPPGTRRLS